MKYALEDGTFCFLDDDGGEYVSKMLARVFSFC